MKLVLLLLLLQVCFVHADEPLCQADWSLVQTAARNLENGEGASVERLLRIMEDERCIRLTDTRDLIYPGALEFQGHGLVVNYALNWLPARAGWVLEGMTFQDFGFSGNLPHREDAGTFVAISRFRRAAERARLWWQKRGSAWTRLGGLQDALGSTSARRQQAALSYLRFPESSCRGLTLQSYRRLLLASVRRLAVVGDPHYEGARDQACLLLAEVSNERTFSIQGIAPGLAEKPLPANTTPFVTFDKERAVLVEGDSLWENGKPLLKRGDDRATISRVLTPLAPAGSGDFLGCQGANCEVVLVLNSGKLVKVELHPLNSQSRPQWAH